MPEITPALVGQLRAMTGAGLMNCKKALDETKGDLQAAVDILRKQGAAAAVKCAEALSLAKPMAPTVAHTASAHIAARVDHTRRAPVLAFVEWASGVTTPSSTVSLPYAAM
jgi:elongation factor Ts